MSTLNRLGGYNEPKLILEMTYSCNTSCPSCCVKSEPLMQNSPRLSLPQVRTAVDLAKSHGIRYVVFTGGEPTLLRGLGKAIAYASSQGMTTRLNTNGWRFCKDYWRRLKDEGLDTVAISIDSSHNTRCHNLNPISIDKPLRTIRATIDAEIETLVAITYSKDQIDKEKEILGITFRYFMLLGGEVCPRARACLIEKGSKQHLVKVMRPIEYNARTGEIISPSALRHCPCHIDLEERFAVRVTPDCRLRVPCSTDWHLEIASQTFAKDKFFDGIDRLRTNHAFQNFLKKGLQGESQEHVCPYCIRTFLNRQF